MKYRAARVHKIAERLPQGLVDPGFEALLARIDGRPPYGGNQVEVFHSGEKAFAAMHAAFEAARSEILLESYIYSDDGTGRSIRDALAAAVARGVRVRVVVDAVGSSKARRAFWNEMAELGIDVRRFNPLLPNILTHPFRDHRKIIVVDRQVGFTGGMNIADEYGSSRRRQEGKTWRDSHVRVTGPAAWELAVVFAESWEYTGGEPLDLPPLEVPPPCEGGRLLVLDSRPNRGHVESAAVFAAVVAAAHRSVAITNAYFAPRRIAIELLGRAVARGVEVTLLLPGKTDVPIVRHAGHGYFAALLERGVRIFEYQPAVLHAKYLVADGYASIVGSTNLDFRSFALNGECNLVVLDGDVGRRMDEAFAEDLRSSEEILLDEWRRRPFPHRLGDQGARLLSPLL